MPPKHDLRGGQASADSFAMFNTTLIPSMNRCFFVAGSIEIGAAVIGFIHGICTIPDPLAIRATVQRRLRDVEPR